VKPNVKVKNDNQCFSLNYLGQIVDEKFIPDEFEKHMFYEDRLENMQNRIFYYNDDIWSPKLNVKCKTKINTNSWFTILESTPQNVPVIQNKYNLKTLENVEYKCKQIRLLLTKHQKLYINNWLNSFIEMYNCALKYIKMNIKQDPNVLNMIYLRSKLLDEKKEIINKIYNINLRKIDEKKHLNIKVHDIDYAIKLACSNWKSGISNLRNGNIKNFRIRYWKKNKSIKIMSLEKASFKSGSIRKEILGTIKGIYNGKLFNFSTIECDCILRKENDEYILLVPEYVEPKEKDDENKSEQITIDLGLRTFGTGITENKIVKIGDECNEKIKKYLKRKDKIMENDEINDKIKEKNEKMINKKVKNLVEDMHWKTIKYLLDNYKNIFIGDISAKGIMRKDGVLTKMNRRITSALSFYKFKQRLKFKCELNKVNYNFINEWMTTKMCSECGEINWEIGSNKIFKCKECGLKMERDVNAPRNMYKKAIKSE
jgi:IS605 OrfB family transposase